MTSERSKRRDFLSLIFISKTKKKQENKKREKIPNRTWSPVPGYLPNNSVKITLKKKILSNAYETNVTDGRWITTKTSCEQDLSAESNTFAYF